MRRSLPPLLLAAALAVPASASAQVRVDVDVPSSEVRFGALTEVTGTVTDAGAPAANREVVLEGVPHPYDGKARRLGRVLTDGDGAFAFERGLRRNWRLTARVGDAAAKVTAHVFPAVTLRYETVGEHVIRLTQRFRVPRDVELSARTRFYVGPRGARRVPVRATARPDRLRSGRYVAAARVRLPARWDGRFRYASCFPYAPGSGMGDPRASCPRRFGF